MSDSTILNVEKNKEIFIEQCNKHIKREGINDLLDYLQNETDFFEAPASTRFHLCCRGGLAMHSLNVFKRLIYEYKMEHQISNLPELDDIVYETLTIISLFHDICKANYYKIDVRNVKEKGVWVKKPYYAVNEKFALGHGEKSVIMLMKFMKLTDEEIVAINTHMGFSDKRVIGGDYSILNEWENYPVAALLHVADLKATKIDERDI